MEKSCNGYVIDSAQRIIQLDPNEEAQFVFTNSIKPSLRLVKTSADGTPLAGVSSASPRLRTEATTWIAPPMRRARF